MDASNEEVYKSIKGKNTYKPWTAVESNELLKLLVDVVSHGWRDKNGAFSKQLIETKILPMLNNKLKSSRSFVEYQIHYGWFKNRYKAYAELLKFSSGFEWDNESKMFTATDEIWNNYFESHPRDLWMKTQKCDEYEDLCMIVGNKYANGKSSISLGGEETDAGTIRRGIPSDAEFDADGELHIYDAYDLSEQVGSSESVHVSLPNQGMNIEDGFVHTYSKKRGRDMFEDENNTTTYATSNQAKENETLTNAVVSIATHIQAIQRLMENRAKEKKKREMEKKENNLWEAIKEIPNLSLDTCFTVIEWLNTKVKIEMFKSLSPKEREAWVSSKMNE